MKRCIDKEIENLVSSNFQFPTVGLIVSNFVVSKRYDTILNKIKPNTMQTVSIFKHFKEVVEDIDIMDVLSRIREPQNVKFFETVREMYSKGETDDYAKTKKNMTAFTVTGTFKGGRKAELMTSYSRLIILDFDKLGDTLEDVKNAIVADSHTYACFISPSGNGLKVIVQVATDQEQHADIFNVVADYYGALTGVAVDTSGRDITRLCFVSYDPHLYVNERSEAFSLPEQVVSNEHEATFDKCVELTNNKLKFEEGQRNNYVFLLASNCKRLGIPEEVATPLIMGGYGYDEQEVAASIKSAYSNNPEEYAKFANLTNLPAAPEAEGVNDALADTPLIPDEVYEQLPALLKDGASVFEDKRQRDVFLTGALSVTGGSMDNVQGVYLEELTFPNLYAFIIAPAASGKGAMKYSKVLGQALHTKLMAQGSSPVKVLFIPANSSASAVIKHLNESDGKGIMFESEADTLNNSLKQEWGNFSDMLRKAFHHEAISSSRTTKDEFVEVEQPRLSIALSGTPNQMSGLIPSAEDGLFSRFMYYAFQGEVEWMDARPSGRVSYNDHFKALSERLVAIVEFLTANPTRFSLTPQQWHKHTQTFAPKLRDLPQFVGEEMVSIVKRMGNMTYRIAMILTALAKAEREATDEAVICSDAHFDAALKLAMTYLDHAIVIYNRMPKTIKVEPSKRKFYDALPSGETSRGKAVEIGKGLGLAERTADKYLREFVAGRLLSNDNYGKYKKP